MPTTTPNTGTGTVNQLLGVNNHGRAAGFYTDGADVSHAYVLNLATGHFSDLTVPGATSATATGINDYGDVSGFATLANGSTAAWLIHHHRFSVFDLPGSANTQALGVNNGDQVVGSYVDGNNNMHGFLASRYGFRALDDPNGVGTTTINGINNRDQIVGFYGDGAGNTDGFVGTPADLDTH